MSKLYVIPHPDLCLSCGSSYKFRPATDDEVEAEVKRRVNDPKSAFYGMSRWINVFRDDLEAGDEPNKD